MKACIDIGGTKVAVSLNSGAGLELLARRSEPTAKEGNNDALARQIIRMVDEACAEAGIAPESLESAGVASCGPFVMRQGLIELAAPNICGGIAGPARGLPNDWKTALLEAPLRRAVSSSPAPVFRLTATLVPPMSMHAFMALRGTWRSPPPAWTAGSST